MADNKDQHYVPKMLMKRFASPEHLFSFVLRNEKIDLRIINSVPYDSQCQYDYYYGRDNAWEHELSTIETKTSPILDKIETDDKYYPSEEEIAVLRQFLMAQHSRIPRIFAWEKATIRRSYIEAFRLYKRNQGMGGGDITPKELKWIDDNKDKEFENSAKKIMRELSFDMTKYISDLECIIVHFDCMSNLVLSDDPVTIVNPFIHSAGFASIGIIILMPINPKILLVFRDPVLYEPVTRIVYSKREKAVNSINKYQATTFDKRLMFYDEKDSNYVFELTRKASTDRKRFNKTGEGGVFYGANDCLMVDHHPTLTTNYPYIFSKIKKEYRKFCCFDSLNYRFFSNGYLERLNKSFPVFALQPMSNINLQKLPSYIDFIKLYWKLHEKYETIKIDIDEQKKKEQLD